MVSFVPSIPDVSHTRLDLRDANGSIHKLSEDCSSEGADGVFCGTVNATPSIWLSSCHRSNVDNMSRFSFLEIYADLRTRRLEGALDSRLTKSWVIAIKPSTFVWNMASMSFSDIPPTRSTPRTNPALLTIRDQDLRREI